MAEINFEVEARGLCAAPREAILAKDIDPFHFAAIEPKMTISDVVVGPDGHAQSWTLTARVAKIFRARFHCLVMSRDPSVVELSNPSQSQTSTLTVSHEPDESGRFVVVSKVAVRARNQWGSAASLAAHTERHRKRSQGMVERQLAATIAVLEAEAAEATEPQ